MKNLKQTLEIRLFGLVKIPMVFFIGPSLVEASAEKVVMKIPLARRNKNHLGSMYFGVLASAADLTAGYLTMGAIRRSRVNVSMVFKSFQADFKRRVEGDAHFECANGPQITEAVAKAIQSGERTELPVTVTATVIGESEPAAIFSLMLSLKKK